MADKHPFKQIVAGNWDEAVKHATHFGDRFVFRGQSNAEWFLSTSLERHCLLEQASAGEQRVLSEFQRYAHHYLAAQHIPDDNDTVEWLALMQHSGTPTRLLDFTRSPYIALFFALDEATADSGSSAVWAVDESWCYSRAQAALKANDLNAPNDAAVGLAITPQWFRGFVLSNRTKMVVPLEPRRANQRLAIQQGLFLAPGSSAHSFIVNMTDSGGDEVYDNFIKLVIPNDFRADGLEALRAMNITSATLFPGLDGFARSLRTLLLPQFPRQRALTAAIAGLTADKASRPTR